jgi:acyl-CoA synthetase (AMP-forming)/AMP-acid ligase II
VDHPAVLQAVTLAMPHDKLGEEVAAAILLREGNTCSERELRDFTGERLAHFNVPRKIVVASAGAEAPARLSFLDVSGGGTSVSRPFTAADKPIMSSGSRL